MAAGQGIRLEGECGWQKWEASAAGRRGMRRAGEGWRTGRAAARAASAVAARRRAVRRGGGGGGRRGGQRVVGVGISNHGIGKKEAAAGRGATGGSE